MTLKQLLFFCHIIVDDTGMSRRVENFCSIIVGQEVHPLVDVLVEAVDFAERL